MILCAEFYYLHETTIKGEPKSYRLNWDGKKWFWCVFAIDRERWSEKELKEAADAAHKMPRVVVLDIWLSELSAESYVVFQNVQRKYRKPLSYNAGPTNADQEHRERMRRI